MKVCCRGRSRRLESALLALLCCLPPAAAQLLGPEFQVNTYTFGAQMLPAVAADSFGNFIVVWTDIQEAAGGSGIFGQGFDPAGGPLGGEFHVNSYTPDSQQFVAVTAKGPNNFLVVWNSDGQDGSTQGVFGRRVSAAGVPAGSEFMVNSYTTGSQYVPAAAMDSDGNFVVVWSGPGLTDSSGVFGQRFNAAGSAVGGEFRVNTFTLGNQQEPEVGADGLGNFVVVWASAAQDGSEYGVFGQRFDSAGTPMGGEFQVNTYTASAQRGPVVAADGAGNFLVAWISWFQDGSIWGVFGQRFNPAGTKVGSEFQVSSFATGTQFAPAVAADEAGNFLVVWEGAGPTDTSGVFGQRFDAAGFRVGAELQINSFTTSTQSRPALAADGSGNFVVTWQGLDQDGSAAGVFGRQMTTTVFDHGFENNPPFWSAATANMCAGFCDSIAPSGCSCEAFCAANFDCCLDACQTCGYCGP